MMEDVMRPTTRNFPDSIAVARGICASVAKTACVALLLVSCGVVNAQQEPGELDILLGDVSLNKLPFVIAYEEGIYAKNGLKARPMFSQGSVDIIRRSGVDVADEFIHQGDSQPPIKIGGAAPTIVRLTTQAGAWDPVVLGSTHRTSRWRIVVRPGINSARDLKGKRIGYSGIGAITHFMAISFAEHMGWDPNLDWSMLGGGLGVDALQNDHVDAFVGPELHATMAVAAGYKLLVDLGDYNFPNAGSSFLFDRPWLRENSDTARRFLKSTVEAIALLKNDKEAAFRTLRKWYQMTDPEQLEFFYLEVEKLPSKPYPPYEGLQRVMEVYDSHEMRKYSIEHFYDDTFIKELDASGYIDSLYQ
ncbi:MAG: ABC transporter substrate-binding protein [Gammaproteobacteria bacterium]|nr:ABC transporter substrate-binding protein [Gammaproteobacteria bacterium]